MNQKIINLITYITMILMAVVVVLMWTGNFPMEYSSLAIFFASIILILRLGYRFYNLITKKK